MAHLYNMRILLVVIILQSSFHAYLDTKCMDNASRKGLSDEEFETPVWKHMNSTHAQPITHEAKNKGLMNVPEENFEESPKKQQIEHENLLDDKFKYSFVSSHSADDLETSGSFISELIH